MIAREGLGGPSASPRGHAQRRKFGLFPLTPALSPREREKGGTGRDEVEGGEVTEVRAVPNADRRGEPLNH